MGQTIFISYRRSGDAGFAGRLFDRLKRSFRRKALFMDVDSIAPGQDFASILEVRVAECDVLLALIGHGWLTATDEAGRRRLNNAEDFVRIEIAAALTQRKRVIPVLIDDVPMPRSEELPEELKPLVRCQATRLSHDRFRADCNRLIRALKQVLVDAEAPSDALDGTSGSQESPLTVTATSTKSLPPENWKPGSPTKRLLGQPNYSLIVSQLLNGAVIPFLGPGASIFRRHTLDPGVYPPSPTELAYILADMVQFPDEPDYRQYRHDLARIASYVEFVEFDRPGLRDYLRPIFNRDFTLNKLHHTLAAVAHHTPLLIITTNYDDMIERAFQTAEPEPLPYHLVVTAIEEEIVKYQRPDSNKLETVNPQSLKLSFNNASIIYKMHGSINRHRADSEEDHYVITQEDYMTFVSKKLMPRCISAFTMNRRFLFIGYGLQDWTFRFMFSHALQAEAQRRKSWAIQYKPYVIEKRFWEKKNVEMFDMNPVDFCHELSEQIEQACLR